MNKSSRNLLGIALILTFLGLTFPIFAQLPQLPGASRSVSVEPVRWSAQATLTGKDTGIVTITAKVSKGWHFYGFTMPQSGPKPTVISFDNSKGVEFSGSLKSSVKEKKEHDKMFDTVLSFWETDVKFTRPFKIKKQSGVNPVIEVNITYMACDNNTCSPPRKVKLTAVPK